MAAVSAPVPQAWRGPSDPRPAGKTTVEKSLQMRDPCPDGQE